MKRGSVNRGTYIETSAPHSDKKTRMCTGKKRFFSRGGAQTAAHGVELKEGIPMNAYRCQVCGYYHVGRISTYEERFHKRLQESIRIACEQMVNSSQSSQSL